MSTGSLFGNPSDVGEYSTSIRPTYMFFQYPDGFPTIQSGSGPSPSPAPVPVVGQLWPRGNKQ